MTENIKTENKPQQNFKVESIRWHFWFIVSSSLLLIITFVYYLPLRFQYAIITDEHGDAMDTHMEDVLGGDAHGGHGAVAHEEGEVFEGIAVDFHAKSAPASVATTTTLSFFVNEKPGDILISSYELELEHEKLMHVIGIRSDMNEFFHIHPNPIGSPEVFMVDHIFQEPGRYKMWSEVKQDDTIHVFGHPDLIVEGEEQTSHKQVSFERSALVGEYQVFLQHDTLLKGIPSSLSFDVHNVLAEDVVLENYLGAQMHLALIKDDLTQLIHTHPEGGHEETETDHHASGGIVPVAWAHTEDKPASPVISTHEESIEFSTVFSEAGLYKAFAQFRPAGISLPPDEALLAEFWIEVKDKEPFPISPWWILLIVSVIAIVIVSKLVNRYLGEE